MSSKRNRDKAELSEEFEAELSEEFEEESKGHKKGKKKTKVAVPRSATSKADAYKSRDELLTSLASLVDKKQAHLVKLAEDEKQVKQAIEDYLASPGNGLATNTERKDTKKKLIKQLESLVFEYKTKYKNQLDEYKDSLAIVDKMQVSDYNDADQDRQRWDLEFKYCQNAVHEEEPVTLSLYIQPTEPRGAGVIATGDTEVSFMFFFLFTFFDVGDRVSLSVYLVCLFA
jgi:hypothetical protein